MKRILGLALVVSLAASVAYGQTTRNESQAQALTPAQQFVLTSKTVPEFWNEEKGWSLVPDAQRAGTASLLVSGEPGRAELTLTLGVSIDVYQNDAAGLHAEVFSWQSKDGAKEKFGMVYGDDAPTVTRFAILVGDRWFVAKEISSQQNRNDLFLHDPVIIQDPAGSLRIISVMVRLDTVDGVKDRLLILK